MPDILFALLGNTLLLAVLLLAQPLWRDVKHGMAYTLSSFDKRRPPTLGERRLAMVKNNQMETLALLGSFAILALATPAPEAATGLWAFIHIGSRIAYALVSLAGIPYLRSGFWTVSVAALAVMAYPIAAAALGGS